MRCHLESAPRPLNEFCELSLQGSSVAIRCNSDDVSSHMDWPLKRQRERITVCSSVTHRLKCSRDLTGWEWCLPAQTRLQQTSSQKVYELIGPCSPPTPDPSSWNTQQHTFTLYNSIYRNFVTREREHEISSGRLWCDDEGQGGHTSMINYIQLITSPRMISQNSEPPCLFLVIRCQISLIIYSRCYMDIFRRADLFTHLSVFFSPSLSGLCINSSADITTVACSLFRHEKGLVVTELNNCGTSESCDVKRYGGGLEWLKRVGQIY